MKYPRINFGAPAVLAFAALTLASYAQEAPLPPPPPQDQAGQTAPGGWRRVDEAPPAPTPGSPADAYGQQREMTPGYPPGYPQQPNSNYPPPNGNYPPSRNYPQSGNYPPPNYRQPVAVPPQVTLRTGTYLTVRIDQPLSSDRNHEGDGFSATLIKPVVVDGVVVAERGQSLGGRVVEARKAGRVEGVSRLAVELIDLPLADGQQIPIKTHFVSQAGDTSIGRDVVGVGGTAAVGAAVGAAAAGGVGAGIGAGAGAVAGLIGVLVTRGHASVIYPESVVTFRIETPVTIDTTHAPQAFRYVDPRDFQRADAMQQRTQPRMAVQQAPYYGGSYGGVYAYPGYYPYYYPYYWGPRYWGPSVGFYFGGRWGGYGYRGYRR